MLIDETYNENAEEKESTASYQDDLQIKSELKDVTHSFWKPINIASSYLGNSISELGFFTYKWATGKIPLPQKEIYHFPSGESYFQGKKISEGFWGKVYYAHPTSLENAATQKPTHVIKSSKTSVLRFFLNAWFELHPKMQNEADLAKFLYGEGRVISKGNGWNYKTTLLLPYLGNISLSGILKKDPKKLTQIRSDEWLTLFMDLLKILKKLHTGKKQLHNDIKPDNIGFTCSENANGRLTITNAIFFDLGNAQPLNEHGMVSDPRFLPLEGYLGIFFNGYKNEKTDVYALGRCLLELTKILIKQDPDNADYRKWDHYFQLMSSCKSDERPSIQAVLNFIESEHADLEINHFSSISYSQP